MFNTTGFCLWLVFVLIAAGCAGQDNYEIQVYGSETVPKGSTMFELHSNLTMFGNPKSENVVAPSDLAWHETVEITQGITPWFEIGGYLFLSGNKSKYLLSYVGDHIRPRIRVPDSWKCPVGLSLSAEVGYQRRGYSEDTWTLEIRPIIDKEWKNLYVSFNPVIDYSIQGLNHNAGPGFSPNLKISYKIVKYMEVGIEYYGSIGAFKHLDPLAKQQHQLGIAFDLDFSPVWEVNFGYMFGLTPATDAGILKLIVGRRVDWKKPRSKKE